MSFENTVCWCLALFASAVAIGMAIDFASENKATPAAICAQQAATDVTPYCKALIANMEQAQ